MNAQPRARLFINCGSLPQKRQFPSAVQTKLVSEIGRDAMHIHTVFFWLSDNIDEASRETFERGLDLLTRETHIQDRSIGKPAATDRDVVDSSYSYAIVLRFQDLAAHDAYQVSGEHQQFLDTCFDMISRVQVYDIEKVFGA